MFMSNQVSRKIFLMPNFSLFYVEPNALLVKSQSVRRKKRKNKTLQKTKHETMKGQIAAL